MSEKYKQYCDTRAVDHPDNEKSRRIVDEMIATNDPDTGKACGSLAWVYYADVGSKDIAMKYALIGSELSDGNSLECLANIYYDNGDYKNAYNFLLRAKEEGNDVQEYTLSLYKQKAEEASRGGKKTQKIILFVLDVVVPIVMCVTGVLFFVWGYTDGNNMWEMLMSWVFGGLLIFCAVKVFNYFRW